MNESTAALAAPDPRLGSFLAARYELVRVVGHGGMSVVYEGLDLRLSKRVAVKIFHKACAARAGEERRFFREARILSRVSHPNLVEAFDLGVTDDGCPYIVLADKLSGTPAFMSPELVRGHRNVDLRTDVWSLGVILHTMLVGELPFVARSLSDLFQEIVAVDPPPVSLTRSDVPREFAEVVAKMLAKNPDERYANCVEAIDALTPYAGFDRPVAIESLALRRRGASESNVTVRRLVVREAATTVVDVQNEESDEERPALPMRSRLVPAAIAVALGACLLGAVATLLS